MLGLVLQCGMITLPPTLRGGVKIKVPPITGSRVHIKTLKENSLLTEGPRLFNSLPRYLRDSTVKMDRFKELLDEFLQTIPDQLCDDKGNVAEAVDIRGYPSNSLKHWARLLNVDN